MGAVYSRTVFPVRWPVLDLNMTWRDLLQDDILVLKGFRPFLSPDLWAEVFLMWREEFLSLIVLKTERETVF